LARLPAPERSDGGQEVSGGQADIGGQVLSVSSFLILNSEFLISAADGGWLMADGSGVGSRQEVVGIDTTNMC